MLQIHCSRQVEVAEMEIKMEVAPVIYLFLVIVLLMLSHSGYSSLILFLYDLIHLLILFCLFTIIILLLRITFNTVIDLSINLQCHTAFN